MLYTLYALFREKSRKISAMLSTNKMIFEKYFDLSLIEVQNPQMKGLLHVDELIKCAICLMRQK